MKTVNEFIEQLVKIEFLDHADSYGHYPFQLFAETKDGKFEMNALALGGNVEACYKKFATYSKDNAKKVFMSLDFPAKYDITHDFVAVCSLIDGKLDIVAIPYDTKTGETFDIIKKGEGIDILMSQTRYFI